MTLKRQVIVAVPLAIVLASLLGYDLMSAQWSGPTGAAPVVNVSAPINLGTNTQIKDGNLGVAIPVAMIEMRSDRYCDATGNNCVTALSGSGGGITALSSGSGITLTPTTIVSTGTVSADTNVVQQRITGTCPVGQAIRVVNANGTVVCGDVPEPTVTCLWGATNRYSVGYACRESSSVSSFGGTITTTNRYRRCTATGAWTGWSDTGGSQYQSCI